MVFLGVAGYMRQKKITTIMLQNLDIKFQGSVKIMIKRIMCKQIMLTRENKSPCPKVHTLQLADSIKYPLMCDKEKFVHIWSVRCFLCW